MTWIPGGGARGTIDDLEGVSDHGREGEHVVDTTRLDLAVDGGDTAGGRRRRQISGDEIAVGDQCGGHVVEP